MHTFTRIRNGATFLGMKAPLPLEYGQRVCPFEVAHRRALLSVESRFSGPHQIFECVGLGLGMSRLLPLLPIECVGVNFLFSSSFASWHTPWLSGLFSKTWPYYTQHNNTSTPRPPHDAHFTLQCRCQQRRLTEFDLQRLPTAPISALFTQHLLGGQSAFWLVPTHALSFTVPTWASIRRPLWLTQPLPR